MLRLRRPMMSNVSRPSATKSMAVSSRNRGIASPSHTLRISATTSSCGGRPSPPNFGGLPPWAAVTSISFRRTSTSITRHRRPGEDDELLWQNGVVYRQRSQMLAPVSHDSELVSRHENGIEAAVADDPFTFLARQQRTIRRLLDELHLGMPHAPEHRKIELPGRFPGTPCSRPGASSPGLP